MIWPLITAFVHSIDRRTNRVNLFEGYIRFIVLIIALPSLLGISSRAMQVVALVVLFYFFRVWPGGNESTDGG